MPSVGDRFKIDDWDLMDAPDVANLGHLAGAAVAYSIWQLADGRVVVSGTPNGRHKAHALLAFGPMLYGEALVRIAHDTEVSAGSLTNEEFVRLLMQVGARLES